MDKSLQSDNQSFITNWVGGQPNKSTAEAYGIDLRRYGDWLAAEGLAVAAATTDDLRRFVDWRRAEGASVATLNRSISAMKAFYKHLAGRDRALHDPARQLARLQIEEKAADVVSVDQMLTILDAAHERARVGTDTKHKSAALARTAAMLETAYSSGFEVSSLLLLPMSILSQGILCRLMDANGTMRHRIINGRAREAIGLWRERAADCSSEFADQWLFHATRSPSKQMNRSQVSRDFQEAGQESGVSLPFILSPTVVRDSLAVHLLKNGMPAHECAHIMGHETLGSFDRLRMYLDPVENSGPISPLP